jgi:Ca2+-binding RTX toxin-like protein
MPILTSGLTSPLNSNHNDVNGVNFFDFKISTLTEYDNVTRSAKRFAFFDDANNSFTFNGTGFSYSGDGNPTGGTVTGFVYKIGGAIVATYTGASVSLLDLFIAANDDDSFLFKSLLFAGNDTVTGSAFNDDLNFFKDEGNDTISGDGDDAVEGGFGDDTLNGGSGADFITGSRGTDTVDGGEGGDDFDTLSYREDIYIMAAHRV